MRFALLFASFIFLNACNLTPEVRGGKIPNSIKAEDISILIKEYFPSDLSLRLADRHIENSSFVITNYSALPDYEPALVGGLGVAILDSEYEIHLPKKLESRLTKSVSLSNELYTQLKRLNVPNKTITLSKKEPKDTKLILEPYSLISVQKSLLIFSPQLIASLYDYKGKFIWQNFYGFKSKTINLEKEWKNKELQDYFKEAYSQIATELKINIQGKEYHHDIFGLDEKFKVEINFPNEL